MVLDDPYPLFFTHYNMNVSLPATLSSGSSSSGSFPKPLNQDTYYQTPYPSVSFLWYTGCPAWQSYTQWTLASYTKTFADHSVVETVWSTSINAYFRSVVDAFQTTGNFYASLANVWSQTELTEWCNFYSSTITWGTYTFSDTIRVASTEKLKAGAIVWADIQYCPAFKFNLNVPFASATGTANSLTVSAVFKLMSTSWTLTTIWTLASTAVSSSTISQVGTVYAFAPIASWTFTPQTAAAWDRIIVELTFSGSIVIVWWSGGSNNLSINPSLWFWYTGSIATLGTAYEAYRPFQVSIS